MSDPGHAARQRQAQRLQAIAGRQPLRGDDPLRDERVHKLADHLFQMTRDHHLQPDIALAVDVLVEARIALAAAWSRSGRLGPPPAPVTELAEQVGGAVLNLRNVLRSVAND